MTGVLAILLSLLVRLLAHLLTAFAALLCRFGTARLVRLVEALTRRFRCLIAGRGRQLDHLGDGIRQRRTGWHEPHRHVERLDRVARLLRERGLTLRATDAAKARLVELGYEPALGARPLKRVILRNVQDPLAEGLLAGRFDGASAVVVDAEGDAIRLDAEAPKDPGVAS